MQRLDLLMIVAFGDVLRSLHGFLGFYGEFVEADHWLLPPDSKNSGKSARKDWGRCSRRPLSNAERLPAPVDYFPLLAAFTVTFTWRGLDSSRFGSVTVRTPFLYSAAIVSAFTVLGSEKLRLNEP